MKAYINLNGRFIIVPDSVSENHHVMLTLQSELFFLYTYFDMSNLQQLVGEKFKAAKESKALFSFETTEVEKESNGINVNKYNRVLFVCLIIM